MIEWVEDRPTIPGLYWFYGDIWWGEMNQSPEKMIPKLEIVEIKPKGMAVVNGHFVSSKSGFGLYSKYPIQIPDLPEIGLPKYNG